MDLHFFSGFSPVSLGNGNLGRRAANRIHISTCKIYKCVRLNASPGWARRVPPVDPLNGGLSNVSPLPGYSTQLAASVGGLCQELFAKTCRIIEFQAGFMPLRGRSGQSCQPCWHGVRGRSGRSLFKVHWNLSPPQVHTHSTHIFNEICLGFLIRLGFSGFVPSIGFPVHLFPFTFVFLFSFMSSCLHVWSSHPFFRLRTQVLALVCKCTTYLNLGFRSPRSL